MGPWVWLSFGVEGKPLSGCLRVETSYCTRKMWVNPLCSFTYQPWSAHLVTALTVGLPFPWGLRAGFTGHGGHRFTAGLAECPWQPQP